MKKIIEALLSNIMAFVMSILLLLATVGTSRVLSDPSFGYELIEQILRFMFQILIRVEGLVVLCSGVLLIVACHTYLYGGDEKSLTRGAIPWWVFWITFAMTVTIMLFGVLGKVILAIQ